MKGWRLIAGILLLLAGTLAGRRQRQRSGVLPQGVTYGISLKRAAEHVVHVDAVTHQPAAEFQLPVWNALYQVRNFAVEREPRQGLRGRAGVAVRPLRHPRWARGKDRQNHLELIHFRRSSLRHLQL